jgi:hypothetical protein
MLMIVDAIYRMMGGGIPLPEDEATSEQRVEKLFQIMDVVSSSLVLRC